MTTRSELNQQRGVHQDASQDANSDDEASEVKSEDLKTDAQASGKPQQTPPQAVDQNKGGYDVEVLRSQVAQLTGQVEDLEHDKKVTADQNLEDTKKLQAKIDELEKQLKDKEEQGPKIPAGKTPLEAAKDSYYASRFTEAAQFLDLYLKSNETGKEAEEAFYLRGMSNFKLKEYNKAIVDFSKFPEKFQKSPYHPKALLGIAESFDALGRKDDAKAFYSDLSDQFPKTAEGKLAKKRLKKK